MTKRMSMKVYMELEDSMSDFCGLVFTLNFLGRCGMIKFKGDMIPSPEFMGDDVLDYMYDQDENLTSSSYLFSFFEDERHRGNVSGEFGNLDNPITVDWDGVALKDTFH